MCPPADDERVPAAATCQPALHMVCFGTLEILLHRELLRPVRSNKGYALLIYLAVEADRPHSRSHLAALLWPDSAEAAARHSLRQTLTNLRQVLGDDAARTPFLLVSQETIQFNVQANHSLDVAAFTALVQACQRHPHRRLSGCQACIARLQEAIALYRGDFLQGFFVKDADGWDEWSVLKREQYQQQVLWALDQLAFSYEERGRYEEAQRSLRRQLETAPWHEEAHRRLMRLLGQMGQPGAALAQYERCRRLLEEELGVEPSPETVLLYKQIRETQASQGEPGAGQRLAPPPPQHNLPAPVNGFIGRETVLAQLQARLADAACRLLTLIGPPGVGKTRLALQTAWDQLYAVAHGVYFVALSAVIDPADVPAAIAHALGLDVRGPTPLIQQVEHYLHDKEILLVLDNFEHLMAAAPLVAQWLRMAPRLQVLVTSRTPLHLYGEQAFPVPPWPCPIPTRYPRSTVWPRSRRSRSSSSVPAPPTRTSR